MKPKRIILVRHGESQANVDWKTHEHTPDYKVLLTEKGRNQAFTLGRVLGNGLRFETVGIYQSPYVRARQTADNIIRGMDASSIALPPDGWFMKIITRLFGLRTVTESKPHILFRAEDPRLREQEYGHLRNVGESEIIDKERKEYGTFFYRVPDGESGADVYDRISGFLDTFFRDMEKDEFPENIILVTHGYTLRIFLMRWLRWTNDQFETAANPKNCEAFVLERDENGRYSLTADFPLRETFKNDPPLPRTKTGKI